jgi:hypothetical protein
MRYLYTAFWIFIGGMLIWQFYDYNHHIDKVNADAGPRPQHFYVVNGKMVNDLTPPAPDPVADVKQIATSYQRGVPTSNQFTYHVTLKNKGTLKATNIQVLVTPFKGIILNDENDNASNIHALADSDPLAQISQWATCPDLGPGEQKTVDAVFLDPGGRTLPGSNPDPPIKFDAVKPPTAPATAPSAPPHP